MTDLRKTARGQDCLVRIPGICNFDPETTVLAHINGGGMGMKQSNFLASYCCSECHDVIDFRVKTTDFSRDEIVLMHWEGVGRTLRKLEKEGLIIVTK